MDKLKLYGRRALLVSGALSPFLLVGLVSFVVSNIEANRCINAAAMVVRHIEEDGDPLGDGYGVRFREGDDMMSNPGTALAGYLAFESCVIWDVWEEHLANE